MKVGKGRCEEERYSRRRAMDVAFYKPGKRADERTKAEYETGDASMYDV